MPVCTSSPKELILYYNGNLTQLNRKDFKKILYSKFQFLYNSSEFNKLLSAFDNIISIQIYNDLVFRLTLTNSECIFLYNTERIYNLIFYNILLNKKQNTRKTDKLYLINSTTINLSNKEEFFEAFLNIIIRNCFISPSVIQDLNYIIRNFDFIDIIFLDSYKIKSDSFYSNKFEYTVKFILNNAEKKEIVIKSETLYYSLINIAERLKKRAYKPIE